MRASEFEEKEYEHPLCSQLEFSTREFWPPGQVLENYLGFDRGLFLTAAYLWDLHGIRQPFRGVVPFSEYWPFLPRVAPHRHRLPSFRLNCFIQVKRCRVGRRLRKELAALGSARPFYRFDVDAEQQRVLDAAAGALTGRALFVYAAPVFSESAKLFLLQQQGQLVENSTFPDIRTLSGHRAWYYNEPGATGVVNQDYEFSEAPPFTERVTALISSVADGATTPESENLMSLSRSLQSSMLQLDPDTGSVRTAYLIGDWRSIARYAERYDLPPAGRAFLEVHAFARRLNMEWFAVADRGV